MHTHMKVRSVDVVMTSLLLLIRKDGRMLVREAHWREVAGLLESMQQKGVAGLMAVSPENPDAAEYILLDLDARLLVSCQDCLSLEELALPGYHVCVL